MNLFEGLHPESAEDVNAEGATARRLRIAAALREFPMVRLLVEKEGVDPDCTYDGKPTALCYSALQKDRCLTQYLLSHGANPNRTDRLGMSAIHYAALGGCSYCLSTVIHFGAEINRPCFSGRTAYSLCAHRADLAECRELLKRYGGGISNGVSQTCFH